MHDKYSQKLDKPEIRISVLPGIFLIICIVCPVSFARSISLATDHIFESSDHVYIEWTLNGLAEGEIKRYRVQKVGNTFPWTSPPHKKYFLYYGVNTSTTSHRYIIDATPIAGANVAEATYTTRRVSIAKVMRPNERVGSNIPNKFKKDAEKLNYERIDDKVLFMGSKKPDKEVVILSGDKQAGDGTNRAWRKRVTYGLSLPTSNTAGRWVRVFVYADCVDEDPTDQRMPGVRVEVSNGSAEGVSEIRPNLEGGGKWFVVKFIRNGGSVWTPTQVNNMQVTLTAIDCGEDGYVRIDAMYAEVVND